MHVTWAPWRMEYIVSDKSGDCIFCTKPQQDADRENYILTRCARTYVILNAYPYNNGHLMIIPYRHVSSLTMLEEDELSEMMLVAAKCEAALKDALRPDGFNIGINIGTPAGAGIADHVHLHVVPRWNGDTNFMPVIGETRVLPQFLADSYDQLRGPLDAALQTLRTSAPETTK